MTITIDSLALTYSERPVFSSLSTVIQKGEFLSIVGPSGCGKSSLLTVLAGIVKADSGSITVDGEIVTGFNHHFAYMPQEDLLLEWKNVYDNIMLYPTLHQQKADPYEVEHYLNIFGLSHVKTAYPNELSGGMKQRVALLRTIMVERDILLLDEPFGALDVVTRYALQDWLKKITAQLNKTIILVTHDIDEALYLSDRILIMNGAPAKFIEDISLKDIIQTRETLNEQGPLRYRIQQQLVKQNSQTIGADK